MLQSYFRIMSLLALAFAMPAVSLAQSCPDTQTQTGAHAPASLACTLDKALLGRIDSARAAAGLGSLETHTVLSGIAARHARDMAERGGGSDVTPEGAALLDLVRRDDRQSLYSTFGANIAIAGVNTPAGQLHQALMQSEDNAANIHRAAFTHTGIGSAEKDGRVYVVQLFARVEGALDEPLPLQAGASPSLRTTLATTQGAALAGAQMVPVSWSVSAPDGALLLRGSAERLGEARGRAVEGYLNLDVAIGQDIYTLRGPFVRID
jgi:uncharacterized protein YkwD